LPSSSWRTSLPPDARSVAPGHSPRLVPGPIIELHDDHIDLTVDPAVAICPNTNCVRETP
jgi:hypothetical protein